jgi:amino acid transporter
MNENGIHGVAGLKKHKIKTSGVVFMIYCLVAAGAFGIEEMIPVSGPGLTLLLLILFPIFWALPISEMVAELGSVLPSEGGAYVWVREGLGEFWGWQVGFWGTFSTWLQQAMYVVLVVGYMGKFIHFTPATAFVVKLLMILIFTVINLLGIKEVSQVSTILSIAVITGFIFVTVVGLANWHYNPMIPFMQSDSGVVQSLGGSICIVIWMYCGYETMSNIAGEIENPQVIPRGLIIAMPIIALSYFLPTLAGLASVGQWQNWATDGAHAVGYMDVLIRYLGPAFGVAFMVVAILSQCSIFNAYIASGSRGFFVMADDHLFPKFLVRLSPKRKAPAVSIIVMALFTVVMCQFEFTTLVMATTPLMLYLYMAIAVAIRRLRKTYPVEERKANGMFVIPGGDMGLNFMTILPFVISLVALYVNGTEYFISGFVMLLISLVGYLVCKWVYGGLYRKDPERYPINPKTRLAEGDVGNIGIYLTLCGIAALAGSIILYLYEGSTGAEYYLEEYGSGFFSDFWGMLAACRWGGIALILAGAAVMLLSRKIERPSLRKTHQEESPARIDADQLQVQMK